jgi:hypothetical protein
MLRKGDYVRLAGIPYWDGLARILHWLAELPSMSPASASRIYWQLAYLVPPLGAILFVVALRRTGASERWEATATALFAGAALLGLYPMADEHHLLAAMPAVLVSIHFAWIRAGDSLAAGRRRWIEHASIAFLAIGFAYLVAAPVAGLVFGGMRFSTLPHLKGLVVRNGEYAGILENSVALSRAAAGKRIALVSPYAGLYYLTAGVRNPIRQDYPLLVTFRAGEQEQVAAAAEAGDFDGVCLDSVYLRQPYFASLRPAKLEAAVRQRLEPDGHAGFCALYVPRGKKETRQE